MRVTSLIIEIIPDYSKWREQICEDKAVSRWLYGAVVWIAAESDSISKVTGNSVSAFEIGE